MAQQGFDISKYITAADIVSAVTAGTIAYVTYKTKQDEPKPEQPQGQQPQGQPQPEQPVRPQPQATPTAADAANTAISLPTTLPKDPADAWTQLRAALGEDNGYDSPAAIFRELAAPKGYEGYTKIGEVGEFCTPEKMMALAKFLAVPGNAKTLMAHAVNLATMGGMRQASDWTVGFNLGLAAKAMVGQ